MKETYHHGDLRNALVAAAAGLVEQNGSDAFSLREAARLVGVTANAAYRHFADKADLLTAVAALGFDQLAAAMQAAVGTRQAESRAPVSAEVRLRVIAACYVGLATGRPQMFRLMFGANGLCRISAARLNATMTSPGLELAAALDLLVVEGRMSAQNRIGAHLRVWSLVHGFAALILDGPHIVAGGAERERALAGLVDFALAALCDLDRG